MWEITSLVVHCASYGAEMRAYYLRFRILPSSPRKLTCATTYVVYQMWEKEISIGIYKWSLAHPDSAIKKELVALEIPYTTSVNKETIHANRLSPERSDLNSRSLGQVDFVPNRPLPTLRYGYLLIRTVAVALNPNDWKHLKNTTAPGATIGHD